MGRLLIGTSGYNYKDWRERFYPKGLATRDWLAYFSKHFNTVEINATFYGSFKRSVFENWAAKTPSDFAFCLKGPRFITHVKRLSDPKDSIRRFFEVAVGLGKKFDVVLWQFASSFKNTDINKERLKKFLIALQEYHPRGVPQAQHHLGGGRRGWVRQAFEFRDTSWFVDDIYTLLNKHKAGFVINDSGKFPSIDIITGNFVYIRFHGPTSLYSSRYSDAYMKEWGSRIKKYLKQYDVYAYFNNDVHGYAIENAISLRRLIGA